MSQQKVSQTQNGHSMFPEKYLSSRNQDWGEKYYLQCIGANGKAFTLQVYNWLNFPRLVGFWKSRVIWCQAAAAAAAAAAIAAEPQPQFGVRFRVLRRGFLPVNFTFTFMKLISFGY